MSLKTMEGPQSNLLLADTLYADHVGAHIYPFSTIHRPPTIRQAFNSALTAIRTDRPGRPYSVISYAEAQVQEQSRKVVLKTYRRINNIPTAKVAQVGSAISSLRKELTAFQRTYREVKAWDSLVSSPDGCDNINQFHGVWVTDPNLIPEALPGIPSIVTDYVEYGSLEYTEGRAFGARVNIVSSFSH
jgi:hypothetical protein